MISGMHTGHDEILGFMKAQFKITSWQTVRRWIKKGMPVHRHWCKKEGWGRPYILESEVLLWLEIDPR